MGWFSLFLCIDLIAFAWMAQVPRWQFNNSQNHQQQPANQGFRQPGFLGNREFSFKQPGFMQPGFKQPGFKQPGFMQPGFKQPGFMQPGFKQPGFMQPGFKQPGFGQHGFGQPGFGQHGFGQHGFGQPSFGQHGFGQPSFGQHGFGQPSFGQHGFGQPSFGQHGFGQPSFGQHGFGQSSFGQHGFKPPGLGQHSFFSPSHGTVERFPNQRNKSGRRGEEPEKKEDSEEDSDAETTTFSSELDKEDAQKGDSDTDLDAELTVNDPILGLKTFGESEDLWDYSSTEHVIVLIPGYVNSNEDIQKKYIKSFCNTLMKSFLKVDKYTIVCYDWRPFKQTEGEIIDLALIKGLSLANYLQLRFPEEASIHLVADNLGCIIAQIAGLSSFRPYNFIIGLNQKVIHRANTTMLYLTRDAAKMVEVIYSNYTPIKRVQRNFYFIPKDDDTRETIVYKAFAKTVAFNGTVNAGIPCKTFYDFRKGHCKTHKKVPVWTGQFVTNPSAKLPAGDFYIPLT